MKSIPDTMKEATTKLLAIIAVIFVTAALVTLPYQNQVANAQSTKRYDIRVTLTSVPANAEDLIMNVTIFGPSYLAGFQETTVSSPSDRCFEATTEND